MNKPLGQILKSIMVIALVIITTTAMAQVSASVERKDGKSTYRNKTVGKEFDIEYKGDIKLNDTDTDVVSISAGGYIEISKTSFGNRRYILIEGESGGKLYREYREGRTKVDWNPSGQEYLAEILPEVVRTTLLAAESRVDRFYQKGGVSAVITEIGRLESDYVASHYLSILLEKSGLSSGELADIADAAGDYIGSDYYLSQVLKDNSSQFFDSDEATSSYLNAAKEIGSDYYMAVVLKEALSRKDLKENQLEDLLEASEEISSDYYVTTVLKEALEQKEMNASKMTKIIQQSREISSDNYQSELIKQVLEQDELDDASIEIVVEAISEIGSDYYVYTILTELLDRDDLSEKVTLSIAKRIMSEINSDHYASEALKKLADKNLSSEGFSTVVEAAANLGSDFYASKVISEIAERDLSNEELIKAIKAASNISSDYYLSVVLVAIAPKVSQANDSVKNAYRDAADNISSETYYGKAMRALRD